MWGCGEDGYGFKLRKRTGFCSTEKSDKEETEVKIRGERTR